MEDVSICVPEIGVVVQPCTGVLKETNIDSTGIEHSASSYTPSYMTTSP